jgi:hypothetical protein
MYHRVDVGDHAVAVVSVGHDVALHVDHEECGVRAVGESGHRCDLQ